MNFLLEGLDRLGKDTLIDGILNTSGYYTLFHRGKPPVLDFYKQKSLKTGHDPKFWYQLECFTQDMALLKFAETSNANLLFNRAWIGEAVYAELYRGYDGSYVFELEKIAGIDNLLSTRLILLTEDFSKSIHFVDDGLSFDVAKRDTEQQMFMEAFDKSIIKDKRIICVTGEDGNFKPKEQILREAIE